MAVQAGNDGIRLDSMLRVDPVDVLTGKESEARIKKFFGDVAKFQKSRNINNSDIIRELEPFLDGRARDLYELAKFKRGYADYDVTRWDPEPGTPATAEQLDDNGQVIAAATPEVPAIPKTLITLFKDMLLKSTNEDTIRLKIKTTGRQRAGEPFQEYSDRVRLMVFQLHNYTYTQEQRLLDEGHTKEFQETMVLLRDGTHPKLYDFLISQSHLTETDRTEAAFNNAKFGAKIWESSNDGTAFLALANKTKLLPSPAPVVPALADPVGGAMSALSLKPKQKPNKKRGRRQPKEPKGNAQTTNRGPQKQSCEYCGILNHTSKVCWKKKRDEQNGIFRDKVEGFPLKPFRQRTNKPNSSFTQQPTPNKHPSGSTEQQDWNNLSSIEWGQLLQGATNQAPPTHSDLHADKCTYPHQ